MSGDPKDDTEQDTPPADPWDAAVDRYRETAKWAIGAFAAIGAIIAGTAPLTGIGDVSVGRGWAVFLGGFLGLLGATVAIACTVAALVPRTVYRHELKAEEQNWFKRWFVGLGPLEDVLAKHPEDLLPQGVPSLDQLPVAKANLAVVVDQAQSALDMTPQHAPERAKRTTARDRLRARLDEIEGTEDVLLRAGRFEKARTGFHAAFSMMVVGAVLAAVGLGLLLYGINSKPKDDAKSPAATAPQEISIALTPEGVSTLSGQVGSSCSTGSIRAILLGGDAKTGPWDVAIVPDNGCNAARFVLTEGLGTIGAPPSSD